ncbi:ATP-grasp domain-containing protein [Zeaxanthinibacter enoshimensis]|uniref:Carbamoyl-phosphate synthase large subunit n=1 Tax=Zeaxanthinibacter enoshimensis TaxID=392009 RepID=A0A4R6TN29_9FLAO|nr:ATP-grasp domain-containing protein [Zeaxanthinibacter enoshimensis]TDQ31159.1 carbamoyl-phosphate synthase large subunit [Zeaxanthinibacter enoshimensis]
MNILITSAGRRVSLVRSFQKELQKIFPGGKVVAADANPVEAAACHVADDAFKVPYLNDSEYINILIRECKRREISLLIPTIDTELAVLSRHKGELESQGIKTVIATEAFISKCRDKRVIHQFFRDHNIAVAKEYSKEDYTLPMFIKPSDGSRSVDTYLIRKQEELKDYHFNNDKLMFLEYLDHDLFDEYTCDLYYDKNHRLKCAVPRKRLEVRDGEVNKGLTERGIMVDFLRNHLSYIEGAVGCLTSQFFKHKQTQEIYGIEINPRFGGGFPLTYLAGANYPKWIIEEYLQDKNIDENFDCWEDRLLMLRYDDEILVRGYQG